MGAGVYPLPCGNPARALIRTICLHEHIEETWTCDICLHELELGLLCCTPCGISDEIPHSCRVVLAAELRRLE